MKAWKLYSISFAPDIYEKAVCFHSAFGQHNIQRCKILYNNILQSWYWLTKEKI